MKTVQVAACQVPEIREDLSVAAGWMERFLANADFQRTDLLCFPECFLQGYLTDYATAKLHALSVNSSAFKNLLVRFSGFHCMFVFGFVEEDRGRLFNSAAVVHRGRLLGCYRKTHLLAGEAVVFTPGTAYPIFEAAGLAFGINICYDTNFSAAAAAISAQGARLIVCPANNMLRTDVAERMKRVHNECRAQRAKETGCWLVSSDVTGMRDGRVSYGPTAVINPEGTVVAQVPLLEVGMVTADVGFC